MKRKLLTILALFLFILPLSACGEDDESGGGNEKIEVRISLSNANIDENADQNYKFSDCARIFGGGTYDKGAGVSIKIEVQEAACQFYGWKIDGQEGYISSKEHYISGVQQSINIKALMLGIDGTATSTSVKFSGINMTSLVNGVPQTSTLENGKFAFPYMTKSDSSSETLFTMDNGTVKNDVTVMSKLSSTFSSTRSIDLNYLYVNNVFQPYKLKWYEAKQDALGTCQTWSEISGNPNDYLVEGQKKICVLATLDTSVPTTLKSEAVTILESSETYVSINNSSAACLSATNSNVNVSEDCMYVKNIGSISTDNSPNEPLYYAINDNDLLESVYARSGSGVRKYSVCEIPVVAGETLSCEQNQTYQIDYTSSMKSILKLSSFMSAIENGSIVYDYNFISSGISPVSVTSADGNTTYYINYLKSPGALYAPSGTGVVNLPSNKTDVLKYTLSLESEDTTIADTLVALKADVEKNVVNLLFAGTTQVPPSGDSVISKVKKTMYGFMNSNSNYNILKNYKMTITIVEQNVNVKFEKVDVSVLFGEAIQSNFVYKGSATGGVSEVCSISKTDNKFVNSTCVNAEEMLNYINNLITASVGAKEFTMSDLTSVDDTITFVFRGSDGLDKKITYNNVDKSFTFNDDLKLTFVVGEQMLKKVTKITLETDTVIGAVRQTFEVTDIVIPNPQVPSEYTVSGTVKTVIVSSSGTELPVPEGAEVSEVRIREMIHKLVSMALYDVEGKYVIVNAFGTGEQYTITPTNISETNPNQFKLTVDGQEYILDYEDVVVE